MIPSELHDNLISNEPILADLFYSQEREIGIDLETTLGTSLGSSAYEAGDIYYEPSKRFFLIITGNDPLLRQNEIRTWNPVRSDTERGIYLHKVEGEVLTRVNRLFLVNESLKKDLESILTTTIKNIYNIFERNRNDIRFETLKKILPDEDMKRRISAHVVNTNPDLDYNPIIKESKDEELARSYPELFVSSDTTRLIMDAVLQRSTSPREKGLLKGIINRRMYPANSEIDLKNIVDFEVAMYTSLGHLLGMEKLILDVLDSEETETEMPDETTVDHETVIKEMLLTDGYITQEEMEDSLEDIYDSLFDRGVFFGINAPLEVIRALHTILFGAT